ncbi:hypothetical protein C0J52_07105 [Blattella germanica]|nr:hypothetical protein C0J52_07105 [Blattella germanica]
MILLKTVLQYKSYNNIFAVHCINETVTSYMKYFAWICCFEENLNVKFILSSKCTPVGISQSCQYDIKINLKSLQPVDVASYYHTESRLNLQQIAQKL